MDQDETIVIGEGIEKKPQNKEQLADILHNKGKLPSLRTYQGDVASFIQSKDKSVAELAIENREKKAQKVEKEKEEEIERAEEEHKKKARESLGINPGVSIVPPEPVIPVMEVEKFEKHKPQPKPEYKQEYKLEEREDTEEAPKKSRSLNFLISSLGVFLLVGSVAIGSYFIYLHYKLAPVALSVPENSLIRFDKIITLDSGVFNQVALTKAISTAKADKNYNNGITNIEIVDKATNSDIPSNTFIERAGLELPLALTRSLGTQFMAGLYGDGDKSEFFLILKENDYGIAYRDMLAWEPSMTGDFNSIIDMGVTGDYTFKDLIVKNKDTRSFSSKYGNVALIYTFLNQSTILITESPTALTNLVNAFATGNSVR